MSNHVTKLTRSSSSSSKSSSEPSPSSPTSSKTVELESPRTAAAVTVAVKEDVQKLQYDALLHLMMTQGISWDYLIYCSYNDIFKLFKPYFNALYSDHLLIITQELDLLNTKVLNEIKTTDPYKELHTDLITTMNGRITQELQTFNFTLQRRAMTLLPTKTFEFEQPIDTSSMYVFHLLKYSQGITTKANFYENAKNGQLKTNHVTFKQRVLPNRIKYLIIYMLTILVVIFSNLGGLFTDNLAIIGNSIMFSILLLTIFVDFNETKRINTQVILYLLEENIFNKTIFLNLLLKMCYA